MDSNGQDPVTESVELDVAAGDVRIRVRRQGDGPALLLLHGFPQTREMWTAMAARLAGRFTVVCADLPRYGESSCPRRARTTSRTPSAPSLESWSP